jgi:CMP-N-acetylneuraminic acid synthetase
MIASLLIGREGSKDFPKKNVAEVLGRPLCWYPMKAAKESEFVNSTYVSTDFDEIISIANKMDVDIIERDPELATDEASGWDAFEDGYEKISEYESEEIEAYVLLLCNSPTMTAAMIDEGIQKLRDNPDLDSVVSVSKYNMHSPVRARKIENGELNLFFSPDQFKGASSHRDSQSDTFFADGLFIIRPRCFDIDNGDPELPLTGNKVYPLQKEAGLDIDFEWEVPQARYWLRKHGFSEEETPYN